ncbi:MAG: UDP-N-acetylglucosamine 2-epimerase (hydrolyzing) [Selenomonadaceae bacterium]|nr:UDP-N-acetylglucosamine 2-epimerase (hydrolyzing) [Selenomonadaceae bacterium]
MTKRKICVITGTRAEYGLLYWLMKEIQADESLQLQIVATGTHLSPEFGLTYKNIEQDGFKIDEKVEMLLSGDTHVAITKSMGVELIGFADVFDRLKPDIAVVLGDRYELLTAVAAALIANIPVAHIHGGEITEGAIDDSIRHSITKMAQLHFVSIAEHRRRVIQMGENPERVYEVGATGFDNIVKLNLLSLKELEDSVNFLLGDKFFLVTYHPVTVESYQKSDALLNLFKALDNFEDYKVLITKSNGDVGGRNINKKIDEYVANQPNRICCSTSLGQLRYLSAMKYCTAVVGNSSSGIWETPVFKKPTVNLGARQKNRHREISIIDCDENFDSIKSAIEKSISKEFQEKISTLQIPYTDGMVAVRIKDVLKNIPLENLFRKKFFDYDINF